MTKECASCRIIQDIDQFSKRSASKDGKSSRCKNCNKAYLKNHYQDNKKYYYNKKIKFQDKGKEFMWNFLKDKSCKDCGINNPLLLEFDHIEDKKYTISRITKTHAPESLLKEISKCEIVCTNCHRLRTYERGNTYYFKQWKKEVNQNINMGDGGKVSKET